jgi:hypothetical protein
MRSLYISVGMAHEGVWGVILKILLALDSDSLIKFMRCQNEKTVFLR